MAERRQIARRARPAHFEEALMLVSPADLVEAYRRGSAIRSVAELTARAAEIAAETLSLRG